MKNKGQKQVGTAVNKQKRPRSNPQGSARYKGQLCTKKCNFWTCTYYKCLGDKICCSQEIQPVNVAPRPNHCAYAISAVPGDTQYFVVIGVADQAPIAAMEEPAAGTETHAVEVAAALQVISAAGENAATSTARPVVTNTDA